FHDLRICLVKRTLDRKQYSHRVKPPLLAAYILPFVTIIQRFPAFIIILVRKSSAKSQGGRTSHNRKSHFNEKNTEKDILLNRGSFNAGNLHTAVPLLPAFSPVR
ncbi:hypothetical protein P9210_09350, partial [Heyndrickxia coagulans]|nr:hypothetical protein [Heyndrickxia coagulans]